MYVSKAQNDIIFSSTMHHNAEIIVENDEKHISAINKHYNETQSGVDTLDQMVHKYMIKRKTIRYPFLLCLIDVANIAVYII